VHLLPSDPLRDEMVGENLVDLALDVLDNHTPHFLEKAELGNLLFALADQHTAVGIM
jgi:hypothetical protein